MRMSPDPDATHTCECRGYSLDPGWSAEEFAGVDVQDARLNRRIMVVSAQFAAQPQASISQACEDWASVKGAYRLFENPKVEPARMLVPHQQRTCARMAGQARVFAVQDTCYVTYTRHPATQWVGLIGSEEDGQVGLIRHSTLVMTSQGVPLGLLTQEIWAREAVDPKLDAAARRAQRRQNPIEAKESYKWLNAVQEAVEL
jgi:Transposase DNA-binding